MDTWRALTVTIDPPDLIDQEGLVRWYLERLGELETSGLLELLPRLRKGAAVGDLAEDA